MAFGSSAVGHDESTLAKITDAYWHDGGYEFRVPVMAAVEGRAHVHSEYALLVDVIVAAESATFS